MRADTFPVTWNLPSDFSLARETKILMSVLWWGKECPGTLQWTSPSLTSTGSMTKTTRKRRRMMTTTGTLWQWPASFIWRWWHPPLSFLFRNVKTSFPIYCKSYVDQGRPHPQRTRSLRAQWVPRVNLAKELPFHTGWVQSYVQTLVCIRNHTVGIALFSPRTLLLRYMYTFKHAFVSCLFS